MIAVKSKQIVDYLQISYRMLDRWVTEGLVPTYSTVPQGRGTDRLYSFQDFVITAVIARLRTLGVPIAGLRTVSEHIVSLALEKDVAIESVPQYLAIFSGGDVFALNITRLGSALAKRREQEVVLVDIQNIVRDLEAIMTELLILAVSEGAPRKHRRSRYQRRRPKGSD